MSNSLYKEAPRQYPDQSPTLKRSARQPGPTISWPFFHHPPVTFHHAPHSSTLVHLISLARPLLFITYLPTFTTPYHPCPPRSAHLIVAPPNTPYPLRHTAHVLALRHTLVFPVERERVNGWSMGGPWMKRARSRGRSEGQVMTCRRATSGRTDADEGQLEGERNFMDDKRYRAALIRQNENPTPTRSLHPSGKSEDSQWQILWLWQELATRAIASIA